MPVEQRDPRQTVKAVSLGVAAVAAAVGFLIFVLWATDRGGVEIALGDAQAHGFDRLLSLIHI